MFKIPCMMMTTMALGLMSLAQSGQAQNETPIPAPSEEAPYLRNVGQEDIFDVDRRAVVNPLRRAAERIAEERKRREVAPGSAVQHIVTLTYELDGDDEAVVVDEAQTRALQSAAARLYFENYLILGRELLEPYLRLNHEKFIALCEVLGRQVLPENRVGMTVKVSVDLDALYRDLNEKKFIITPKLRPTVAVHLQEIINSQGDDSAGGRGRIEATLEQNLFRSFSEKMRAPGLGVDVSTDADMLMQARNEAQKNDIDVLLTGTLVMRPVMEGPVLFDNYSFQEADVTLKMYRVDDGALIAEAKDQYSAAGDTDIEGRDKALDFMLDRVTRKMARELGQFWNSTILDRSSYRLMVTGVGPEDETMVFNFLKTIDANIQVFQKANYGDVMVLNVVADGLEPVQMETLIRESSQPQFSVRKIDKRHYELQVL